MYVFVNMRCFNILILLFIYGKYCLADLSLQEVEDQLHAYIITEMSEVFGSNIKFDNNTELSNDFINVTIYKLSDNDNKTELQRCKAQFRIIKKDELPDLLTFHTDEISCVSIPQIIDYIDDVVSIKTQESTSSKYCPNCPSDLNIESEGAQNLFRIVLDDLRESNKLEVGESNLLSIQRQTIYTGGIRYFVEYEIYSIDDPPLRKMCKSLIFHDRSGFDIRSNGCGIQ